MIDQKIIDEMLEEIQNEMARNDLALAEVERQLEGVQPDENAMREAQGLMQEAIEKAKQAGSDRAAVARARLNMETSSKTTRASSKRARSFI